MAWQVYIVDELYGDAVEQGDMYSDERDARLFADEVRLKLQEEDEDGVFVEVREIN